jgi:hypothetical protein
VVVVVVVVKYQGTYLMHESESVNGRRLAYVSPVASILICS